ncbi:GMC oxidoreductase [Prolixibacter sp. NT017]|uniref:GMC oxidoreductase n=1 Tax=Prolixibacter sp. NT017 TaxID=2652390 RepID=UPI00127D7801|nr:GMC family oxidoreductase [Prolixibacter sp. NT017]GET24387.1 dehydrogenase [Prolixibacter sp. NT017]
MQHYDFIIIGTGAGGGTLARKLAPTGKKILILERGDYIPREKENWDTEEVFLKARYKAKENWTDKDGKSFHPGIHYCVGGNTKVYGAALLRMREQDFDEVKHHGGISPAWDIKYNVLASYYLEAEKLYSVHGLRGSDPTEPAETNPYSLPPLEHEPRIQELFDDIKKLGLKPFPLPIGFKNGEENGESKVVLDRFDGFPDPTESKADAHVVGIKEALKYANVTLETNSYVSRLLTDGSGKEIKSVEVIRNGETISYSANIVVVSAGAINSAALLLRSANEKHPKGLANGSDAVGRHYMAHNNSAMVALSTKPNPTKFGKTFAINDYYFGTEDFDFPMGHIQMLGKSDALMFRDDAPSFAPGLTLDYMAKHALDFWMTSEDLPLPENRVTLDKNGNIVLSYSANNIEGHKRLQKKLRWILEHTGCETHLLPNNIYLGKKIPIAGTAHQCGTIRFGNDPKTSALNINCRAHEVENLYVVDGSFFPSSSAVNPALTIMANALRVGDHLINEIL